MTYEEAELMALNYNSDYDTCYEYESAYHFIEKDNDSTGDNGIVILKENSERTGFIDFVGEYRPRKAIQGAVLMELYYLWESILNG